jgi:hypothetical protein
MSEVGSVGTPWDMARRALRHMNANNWDVVSLCVLLAPRAEMSTLGSEVTKERLLVQAGLAFNIARYLRTFLREADLSPVTHAEWIDMRLSPRRLNRSICMPILLEFEALGEGKLGGSTANTTNVEAATICGAASQFLQPSLATKRLARCVTL